MTWFVLLTLIYGDIYMYIYIYIHINMCIYIYTSMVHFPLCMSVIGHTSEPSLVVLPQSVRRENIPALGQSVWMFSCLYSVFSQCPTNMHFYTFLYNANTSVSDFIAFEYICIHFVYSYTVWYLYRTFKMFDMFKKQHVP